MKTQLIASGWWPIAKAFPSDYGLNTPANLSPSLLVAILAIENLSIITLRAGGSSDCGNTLCGQGGQLLTAELRVLDTRKKILTAKIAKKSRKGREENQL